MILIVDDIEFEAYKFTADRGKYVYFLDEPYRFRRLGNQFILHYKDIKSQYNDTVCKSSFYFSEEYLLWRVKEIKNYGSLYKKVADKYIKLIALE